VKQPKKVLVVGVGRFGAALIDELWESGCDLIVVDKDADAIDSIKSKAGAAFIADATDPTVLDNIGARDVDVAVVTAGEAFEGVVLCVSVLAELGVKVIFARAANDRQASVLRRSGAQPRLERLARVRDALSRGAVDGDPELRGQGAEPRQLPALRAQRARLVWRRRKESAPQLRRARLPDRGRTHPAAGGPGRGHSALSVADGRMRDSPLCQAHEEGVACARTGGER
jgi:hypothetical protein